ncbi:MAG: type II toxin-antitoxin system RelE/ParE family toxin [Prosthecobacter sp.]|nr:type II toxin-antitoxin system RelE/ParE family toxin [Prosthecobacter sp.]
MTTSYGFHPEALLEYVEATNYYLQEASGQVADRFVVAVESAISALIVAPTRWRVVEDPEIRRYIFKRFPLVIYYRWEPQRERVTIYALMHCSRESGYWHQRLEGNA